VIIIMGWVQVNPSDLTESLKDIEVIGSGTRAETGCLFYAVILADSSAGRMLVAERWQDQESLTAHLQGEQLAAFRQWADRISIDVLQYDASNERPLLA
jgi:quinol monooxygenase YgiN